MCQASRFARRCSNHEEAARAPVICRDNARAKLAPRRHACTERRASRTQATVRAARWPAGEIQSGAAEAAHVSPSERDPVVIGYSKTYWWNAATRRARATTGSRRGSRRRIRPRQRSSLHERAADINEVTLHRSVAARGAKARRRRVSRYGGSVAHDLAPRAGALRACATRPRQWSPVVRRNLNRVCIQTASCQCRIESSMAVRFRRCCAE